MENQGYISGSVDKSLWPIGLIRMVIKKDQVIELCQTEIAAAKPTSSAADRRGKKSTRTN